MYDILNYLTAGYLSLNRMNAMQLAMQNEHKTRDKDKEKRKRKRERERNKLTVNRLMDC
jgi:hypothetical protein